MNHAWTFARTYFVALVVVMVLGITAAIVTRQISTNPTPGFGAPRPTPAQLRTYVLEYTRANAKATILSVDVDGVACRVLSGSADLMTACVLALNIDPAFIASQAFGRLNVEDTPAYEAIIWRATLDADPNICDRGGLLGDRLAGCRIAASAGPYQQTRDGLTVTIGSPRR
jgi:hypothetical protein